MRFRKIIIKEPIEKIFMTYIFKAMFEIRKDIKKKTKKNNKNISHIYSSLRRYTK